MFLGLYLEALDEELVTLHSSISTHKPASTSTLKVEKLKEETQLGEGQAEMRELGYTVRQYFLLSLHWTLPC